jgi:diguanylate cyclase (GGDEF)-like protein
VRLLDRHDTSLAVALVAGALVIFQQPLRHVFDAAREVDLRYHIDLVPGLTVLVTALAFHQYRKRVQAKAATRVAESEAAHERGRAEELERLVAFGCALGGALDAITVKQVFWRHLPTIARERELWMLTAKAEGWDSIVRDATASSPRSVETLEGVAAVALAAHAGARTATEGLAIEEDICFPMVVEDMTAGVVGVRNEPALSMAERRAMAAAVALLAIAMRNVQLLARTRDSSLRDPLTGCFNRSYALEALTAELKRARRGGTPVSVMMLDIDNLKEANDRFGHLAGDSLLEAVGRKLNDTLRAGDIKCRYGGDEFLVVLPDTSLAGAHHAAAAVTRDIAELEIPTSSGILSPTVSVGVTVADAGDMEALAMLARADEALYEAKQRGRNRYAMAPAAPPIETST